MSEQIYEGNQQFIEATAGPQINVGPPPETVDQQEQMPTVQAQPTEDQIARLAATIHQMEDNDDDDLPEEMEEVVVPPVMEQIAPAITPDQAAAEEAVETSNVPPGFDEPFENEWIMTRAQIGRSRNKKLKTMKIRIASLQYQSNGGCGLGWWKEFGMGTVPSKFEGFVFNYDYVIQLSSQIGDTMFYVEHSEPDPNIKRRRCRWDVVLGASLVQMLRAQPKNSMFRAKACAVLKEMPPEECNTVEKLKDWVEYNFPKSPKETKLTDHLPITVNYSYVESGRCRYRKTISGSHNTKLTRAKIIETASEHSDIDDLLNDLVSHIEADALDHGSETANEDSMETEGHEAIDTSNQDFTLSTELKSFVTQVLREEMTPEECDDYGI